MRSDASNKLLSSRLPAALAVFKKSPLFKLRGAKTRSRVVETGKQPHSPKLRGSWPTECDRSEFARVLQQQWVGYPRTSRCEVRPRDLGPPLQAGSTTGQFLAKKTSTSSQRSLFNCNCSPSIHSMAEEQDVQLKAACARRP